MSAHVPDESGAVVRAQGCTKIYGDGHAEVTAVSEVDLSIGRGELVALVGPSGSGKSTLLSMLGALLTPTTGRVFVEAVDVGVLNERERTALRARRIGFVFQASGLVQFLTAQENVAAVGSFTGMPRGDIDRRTRQLLGQLGLAERTDHLPEALSGGERQRVSIARALLADPPVLLADEPTAHLDHERGEQVIRLLADAVHDGTRAGLVVTHDPAVAAHADRVVHITDGRLDPTG